MNVCAVGKGGAGCSCFAYIEVPRDTNVGQIAHTAKMVKIGNHFLCNSSTITGHVGLHGCHWVLARSPGQWMWLKNGCSLGELPCQPGQLKAGKDEGDGPLGQQGGMGWGMATARGRPGGRWDTGHTCRRHSSRPRHSPIRPSPRRCCKCIARSRWGHCCKCRGFPRHTLRRPPSKPNHSQAL